MQLGRKPLLRQQQSTFQVAAKFVMCLILHQGQPERRAPQGLFAGKLVREQGARSGEQGFFF
jgi:hypothetical protein